MQWKTADRSIDKAQVVMWFRRNPVIINQLTSLCFFILFTPCRQPFLQGNTAVYTIHTFVFLCSSLCWLIDFLKALHAQSGKRTHTHTHTQIRTHRVHSTAHFYSILQQNSSSGVNWKLCLVDRQNTSLLVLLKSRGLEIRMKLLSKCKPQQSSKILH